uniref:Uncharacterized protein n=1 Tax=Rhizophora mucronata TaxID=61149 RepID=A0A2P2QTQ5_RHIMU
MIVRNIRPANWCHSISHP